MSAIQSQKAQNVLAHCFTELQGMYHYRANRKHTFKFLSESIKKPIPWLEVAESEDKFLIMFLTFLKCPPGFFLQDIFNSFEAPWCLSNRIVLKYRG